MTVWQTNILNIKTVLIVTLDIKAATIWDILFRQKNYRVIHETSPRHALQAARLLSPALTIIDLDLPVAERISLCREIRSSTQGALLLLAPQSTMAETSEYYRAGVDERLSPTISPAALLNKSLTWLARNQAVSPRMQLARAYV